MLGINTVFTPVITVEITSRGQNIIITTRTELTFYSTLLYLLMFASVKEISTQGNLLIEYCDGVTLTFALQKSTLMTMTLISIMESSVTEFWYYTLNHVFCFCFFF